MKNCFGNHYEQSISGIFCPHNSQDQLANLQTSWLIFTHIHNCQNPTTSSTFFHFYSLKWPKCSINVSSYVFFENNFQSERADFLYIQAKTKRESHCSTEINGLKHRCNNWKFYAVDRKKGGFAYLSGICIGRFGITADCHWRQNQSLLLLKRCLMISRHCHNVN